MDGSTRRAAFLLLVGITPSLHAQDWGRGDGVLSKAIDANGDGTVSAEEIEGAAAALRLLDDNFDGVLSPDELADGSGDEWGDWDDENWDDEDWGDWGDFDDWEGDLDDEGAGGDRPTELLDPSEVGFEDGTDTIPDRATFQRLSALGEEILGQHGLEYVKFEIEDEDTPEPRLYFINTKTHPAHSMFMSAIGKSRGPWGMRGALIHRPMLIAPNGTPGLYTVSFEMQDAWSFEKVALALRVLEEQSEFLRGRLAYAPVESHLGRYREEQESYERAGLPVMLPKDVYGDIGYLPLNRAISFGRLRVMGADERPGPRDVVIYRSLPNEMPRVAGVITTVRQTPLSHVNLRAIQDGIPNSFVVGAEGHPAIAPLIGEYVRYEVTDRGFEIRKAQVEEVNAHFAVLRPAEVQVPTLDLSVTEIRALDALGFDDASSVGAKAANLAVLRSLDLPGDPVPAGFAVPFHFYVEFMRHNGLLEHAAAICSSDELRGDTEARIAALDDLRKRIKKGSVPPLMAASLAQVHAAFPVGTSLRCRSSTNNEDLPGFSGAGLYDSYTHKPDEGHLSKSVKQVFASLWNFRAYEEREFFRVDHQASAMAVLIHPNYSYERINGVAVTEDVVYQTFERDEGRFYYVNALVGEDLVTNPSTGAVPEELLMSPRFPVDDVLIRRSSQVAEGARILGPSHLYELRLALKMIHQSFSELYGAEGDEPFAMEIEFKVTAGGRLAIKQARPWIF